MVLSSCRETAGTKRKLDKWDVSEMKESEGAIIYSVPHEESRKLIFEVFVNLVCHGAC